MNYLGFVKRLFPFFLTFSMGVLVSSIFAWAFSSPAPRSVGFEEYRFESRSYDSEWHHKRKCRKKKKKRKKMHKRMDVAGPAFDYPPIPPETLILPDEIKNAKK